MCFCIEVDSYKPGFLNVDWHGLACCWLALAPVAIECPDWCCTLSVSLVCFSLFFLLVGLAPALVSLHANSIVPLVFCGLEPENSLKWRSKAMCQLGLCVIQAAIEDTERKQQPNVDLSNC